jgi:hypothetical protein
MVLALVPSAATAELVTFRGGRVLNVASVTFSGDSAKVTLRSGGEMWVPRDFVVSVAPDEVPYVAPVTEHVAEAVAVPIVSVEAEAGVDAVPTSRGELMAMVDRLAAQHGVRAELARAVVQVESNYESRAVSPKGAMGLMQLMPATARQYALQDPFDPAQNLDAGLRHLRGLLDRYGKGRESLALAAYNAGEGAVTRYRGIPPFRETQNYVRRILTLTGR